MRDFKEQHQTIKKFLLGQLSDDKANEIEARIFAEADFAEEVQIVESELATEYLEGNLIAEERIVFAAKYFKNKANRTTLEYEQLFRQFIRSKSEGNLSRHGQKSESSDSASSDIEINAPPVPLKPERARFGSWFRASFRNRALVYSTIMAAFLLFAVVVWYLAGQRAGQPSNPLEAQRQAIEADLAHLNAAGTFGEVLLTVNLQPAERDRGAMARVAIDNTSQDALIEFRLSLTEASNQQYRVLFLDDRHHELFSISKLTAQATPGGPEIRFVVPARYLIPGDYQINLGVTNKTGGNDDVNSYAVRVVTKE